MLYDTLFALRRENFVKSTPRTLASLALVTILAFAFGGCEKGPAGATATPATPPNEVDLMINDYEKATNEYVKVAKRLKGGDVSVTVRFIVLGKELREWPAKHQQTWARMTPPQAKRAADIGAKSAPYLQETSAG